MEPDFWHDRWQKNQIGFHQSDINPHLRQYWAELAVPTGAPVFVPLAGKSRDMLWLRGQGHPVIGVEISPLAVAAFFNENQLEPELERLDEFTIHRAEGITLYCGDAFNLSADLLVDVGAVYDRASLVALPAALRQRYASHLLATLPEQAPTLLVTFEYLQQEMSGPPFSVSEAEVQSLYASTRKIDKLFDEDVLHQEPKFQERGLSWVREKVYRLTP